MGKDHLEALVRTLPGKNEAYTLDVVLENILDGVGEFVHVLVDLLGMCALLGPSPKSSHLLYLDMREAVRFETSC